MKEGSLDKKLLGGLIHTYRKRLGIKNLEEFKQALIDKSGFDVSPQTLYRVESGVGVPSLELFLAIDHLLSICDMPVSLFDDANRCMNYKEVE